MPKHGLLIDYMFCTGCHSCEVACAQAHNLLPGTRGIEIASQGPVLNQDGGFSLIFTPIPTELCDLCTEDVRRGGMPACVRHCQAGVMKFGTVAELAEYMDLRPGTMLWVPDTEEQGEAGKFMPTVERQVPEDAEVKKAICLNCTSHCGVLIHSRSGRILRVEGDAEDPVSMGWTCSRGRAVTARGFLRGTYNHESHVRKATL